MPTYKVTFRKEFEIFIEAPSGADIRKAFDGRNFDPDGPDWETGKWKMFTAGPVGRPADHFLDQEGDIRHIDDRKCCPRPPGK